MKTQAQQSKESLREEISQRIDNAIKFGWEGGFEKDFLLDFIEKKMEENTLTHTKKLLQAEIDRLEGMKKIKHIENCPLVDFDVRNCGGCSITIFPYNQAIDDQITHLQEQIIKLKE